MTDRFTDEQLREWLYAAQFDHAIVDGDHDFDANPLPCDTFPPYYDNDYNPTLAALFRELLAWRTTFPALRLTLSSEGEPADGDRDLGTPWPVRRM